LKQLLLARMPEQKMAFTIHHYIWDFLFFAGMH